MVPPSAAPSPPESPAQPTSSSAGAAIRAIHFIRGERRAIISVFLSLVCHRGRGSRRFSSDEILEIGEHRSPIGWFSSEDFKGVGCLVHGHSEPGHGAAAALLGLVQQLRLDGPVDDVSDEHVGRQQRGVEGRTRMRGHAPRGRVDDAGSPSQPRGQVVKRCRTHLAAGGGAHARGERFGTLHVDIHDDELGNLAGGEGGCHGGTGPAGPDQHDPAVLHDPEGIVEGGTESCDVGVVADHPLAIEDDRVDGADELRAGRKLMKVLDDGLLDGVRDVEPREAHTARGPQQLRDVFGTALLGGEIDRAVHVVHAVTGALELVHGRGQRLGDALADEADQHSTAASDHAGSLDGDGHSPSVLGSHMTASGNRMTSTTITSDGMMKGRQPLNTSPTRVLETAAVTNSTVPTGGVSRPIMSEMMSMTPSTIGSTPYSRAIGMRIGTTSTRMAVASMTVPRMSARSAASARKTVGLSVSEKKNSVRICGRRSRARM